MSQEIQTVGVRANAICGAEAETQTNDERIQRSKDALRGAHPSRMPLEKDQGRLESDVRLRLCCAYQVLFNAITPADTTEVVGDVCVGAEFLCTDAMRELNELERLGRFEHFAARTGLEEARLILDAAIDILKLATMDDCLGINVVYGVIRLLSSAEDSLETAFRKDESSKKTQTNEVLQ